MDIGLLNYQWSMSIIHHYALSGVQHAVISPGSRSTPLTLACGRHPDIQTWVQVDERSAAFFALGLANQNQQPVILVCTSGSAVANWLPAVVEANYSQVPLILLSADRPPELQYCGANQTIDQQHLFGSHVRAFYAVAMPAPGLLATAYLPQLAARSKLMTLQPQPGPVHLNVPFKEPLLPVTGDLNKTINRVTKDVLQERKAVRVTSTLPTIDSLGLDVLCEVIGAGDGLIIVGRGQYSDVFANILGQLAKALKAPVVVDQLSSLRFGKHQKTNFIVNYDLFLKQTELTASLTPTPKWIIRFGQFPVSKSLATYLAGLSGVASILVNNKANWQDPLLMTDVIVQAADDGFCQQLLDAQCLSGEAGGLLTDFQALEDQAAAKVKTVLTRTKALFEGHIISSLLDNMESGSFIFTANSTAVRDLDTFGACVDKSIAVYCNRGTSGIDGNLSTYLGVLATDKHRPGVALLGDLTFFHDLTALALCSELTVQGYSGTVIVINNNGGHIFNYLPQHELQEFEQYWLTPQNLNIKHAAGLFGLSYLRVEQPEQLDRVLSEAFASPGVNILEVVVDQAVSLSAHKNLMHQ